MPSSFGQPTKRMRDIESHLTNMGLEAEVLIQMSKTMHTCIVGQQTGSWVGRIVHRWHANLQQHVPAKTHILLGDNNRPSWGLIRTPILGHHSTHGHTI